MRCLFNDTIVFYVCKSGKKVNYMIIGTCGFCSTGSSAVSDYLKEFDDNQVLDGFEFAFVYLPDGIEDLDYHLNRNINRDDNCGIAVPRFRRAMKKYEHLLANRTGIPEEEVKRKTEDFLDGLIQLKWKSKRRTDPLLYPTWKYKNIGVRLLSQRIIPILNKFFHKQVLCYPFRMVDVCVRPVDFIEKSKELVFWYLEQLGADFSKNIVLDQPFIGNDPAKSFPYYGDAVAFVVDRDPRDNYIFSREYLNKKGRFMPTDTVEEFVRYYKLLRDRQPYQQPNNRICRLNFEEMVYDYDNATAKIRSFLNLPDNPRPRSIFDPSLSINNTQLILKFPQYQKDIEYIERMLPEYLFDFSIFPKPDNSGKMFMGKSPLNKSNKR